MGASCRPHRQARSARPYKDSFSDDDDCSKAQQASNIPSTRPEKDPPRKNLALKRASRSQERANAKERAEAVQLQRAINESLARDSTEPIRASSESSERSSRTVEVVDSEDEAVNVTLNSSVAFQCLLDVVSEVGLRDTGPANETAATIASKEDIEKKPLEAKDTWMPLNGTLQDPDSGQAAAHKDDKKAEILEDDDWSCEEEEEDDDLTEEDSSDVSEDLRRKKKRQRNSQQKGQTRLKKEIKDNPFTVQVKKVRSTRPVSKVRARLSANSSSFAASVGEEASQPLKVPDGKENTLPSHRLQTKTRKAAKNHVESCSNTREGNEAITSNSCQTLQTPWKSAKVPLIDNASCESPGAISFQAQSPTVIHRRVIGLSRRFRPPPLHPYLSKMDG